MTKDAHAQQAPAEEEGEPIEQNPLRVVLVTGDKAVFDGDGWRVVAPATEGQITVGDRHAPLLARLEPGELVVKTRLDEESFAIGGGFIEVRDNQVIILADTAERAEEIDIVRAEAARRRARMLVERYRGRPEAVAARQALRRSRARLRAARRARGRSA
jgi:F-type H+-transporting ATPase subunit epsilon